MSDPAAPTGVDASLLVSLGSLAVAGVAAAVSGYAALVSRRSYALSAAQADLDAPELRLDLRIDKAREVLVLQVSNVGRRSTTVVGAGFSRDRPNWYYGGECDLFEQVGPFTSSLGGLRTGQPPFPATVEAGHVIERTVSVISLIRAQRKRLVPGFVFVVDPARDHTSAQIDYYLFTYLARVAAWDRVWEEDRQSPTGAMRVLSLADLPPAEKT